MSMQTFDYNFLKDLSRPSKRKGNVQKSLLKAEKDEEQYEKTIFKHVEPSHQENNFVAFIGADRAYFRKMKHPGIGLFNKKCLF